MVDFSWLQTTPLSHIYRPGHYGAKTRSGLTLAELGGFDLVQVMARRGEWSAAEQACQTAYGQAAPAKPLAVSARDSLLIWSGPGQFLVLSPRAPDASGIERARLAFAGTASVSEQSDGRALLRLSGPRVREMLAKVCSLDLHPDHFAKGCAAATSIDHTPVNLWRSDDDGNDAVFHLLIFATFAQSLWQTLLDSGAEYGVTIDAASTWQA